MCYMHYTYTNQMDIYSQYTLAYKWLLYVLTIYFSIQFSQFNFLIASIYFSLMLSVLTIQLNETM